MIDKIPMQTRDFIESLFDSNVFVYKNVFKQFNDIKLQWKTEDCYYIGKYHLTNTFKEQNVIVKIVNLQMNDYNRFDYKFELKNIKQTEDEYILEYEIGEIENRYPIGIDFSSTLIKKSPTKSNPNRTVIEKIIDSCLNKITKNSFDYFIHKDLKGFLNNEMDVYIKNNILKDILDSNNVEEQITKAKVFKDVATPIIDFLSQIEEFQKSLWLKKKFIYNANYCLTLDKIPSTT